MFLAVFGGIWLVAISVFSCDFSSPHFHPFLLPQFLSGIQTSIHSRNLRGKWSETSFFVTLCRFLSAPARRRHHSKSVETVETGFVVLRIARHGVNLAFLYFMAISFPSG